MPPVGFEPTISTGEQPKTYALDRAATGTGNNSCIAVENECGMFNHILSLLLWNDSKATTPMKLQNFSSEFRHFQACTPHFSKCKCNIHNLFLHLNPQTSLNYCLRISFTEVPTVLKSLQTHCFLFKASKSVHICMLFNDALNG